MIHFDCYCDIDVSLYIPQTAFLLMGTGSSSVSVSLFDSMRLTAENRMQVITVLKTYVNTQYMDSGISNLETRIDNIDNITTTNIHDYMTILLHVVLVGNEIQ